MKDIMYLGYIYSKKQRVKNASLHFDMSYGFSATYIHSIYYGRFFWIMFL